MTAVVAGVLGVAVIAALHVCESRFGNVPFRCLPGLIIAAWRSR